VIKNARPLRPPGNAIPNNPLTKDPVSPECTAIVVQCSADRLEVDFERQHQYLADAQAD
jgi:hypothetical protein